MFDEYRVWSLTDKYIKMGYSPEHAAYMVAEEEEFKENVDKVLDLIEKHYG